MTGHGATGTNHRTARLIAVVAGLVGAALAIATPLLPVKQTTAQLNWPQNGVMQSVDAPLIGYVATDLKITVPCSAAAWLPPRSLRGAKIRTRSGGRCTSLAAPPGAGFR